MNCMLAAKDYEKSQVNGLYGTTDNRSRVQSGESRICEKAGQRCAGEMAGTHLSDKAGNDASAIAL